MTSGHEHLSHTADVKIRAWGETLSQVFNESARAFTNCITDVNAIQPHQQRSIHLRAPTIERLFHDFLSELVYLKDTSHFIPCGATLDVGELALSGTLFGDTISLYETHGDIKAPTLHDLHIEKTPGRVTVEFVLDI